MTTAPTYANQRDLLQLSMAEQAPAELLDGFAAAARRLATVDFAGGAPQVGDHAPGFALPDEYGEEIHLSSLLRRGPVVLIFYHGEWCPYCHLQLRTFQAHLGELAECGAQLVAISPRTPDHSLSMAAKNELGFPVLSDLGAQVIDRYGLRYEVEAETRALLETAGTDLSAYNSDGGWVLLAVATFVLDTGGVVRYANVSGDWTERAEPTEVLDVLVEMARPEAA
jgi:peroxiredoxin